MGPVRVRCRGGHPLPMSTARSAAQCSSVIRVRVGWGDAPGRGSTGAPVGTRARWGVCVDPQCAVVQRRGAAGRSPWTSRRLPRSRHRETLGGAVPRSSLASSCRSSTRTAWCGSPSASRFVGGVLLPGPRSGGTSATDLLLIRSHRLNSSRRCHPRQN